MLVASTYPSPCASKWSLAHRVARRPRTATVARFPQANRTATVAWCDFVPIAAPAIAAGTNAIAPSEISPSAPAAPTATYPQNHPPRIRLRLPGEAVLHRVAAFTLIDRQLSRTNDTFRIVTHAAVSTRLPSSPRPVAAPPQRSRRRGVALGAAASKLARMPGDYGISGSALMRTRSG